MAVELARYQDKWDWRPSDPSENCVRWIGPEGGHLLDGKPYEDFLCLYPWMEKFYMKWELTFKPYALCYYLLENHWIPVLSVSLYGVMLVYGTRYFRDRKPWSLRTALMLWNLSLALFSIIGFIRVSTTCIHVLMNYTWRENLCFDPHIHTGHNINAIWIILFSLSKIAELLDTFFIIVHKKPLILLHWWHHISVLLVSWFFLVYTAPGGIFFGMVNYGVHSIMYFYYFLMAAKIKPKWMNPKMITIIQIAQMVVGCTVTFLGMYLNWVGQKNCYTKPVNALPMFGMFFSYLILFGKFFYDRYVLNASKKEKEQKKKSL